MRRYFKVVAKCGHVGRDCYYRGDFYVCAENGKAAAKAVRYMPRVKHHHKDAILDVFEISKKDYIVMKTDKNNEVYFKCKNIQEQKLHWDEIEDKVFYEKETSVRVKKDRDKEKTKKSRYKKTYFDWRRMVYEELNIA